MVSILGGLEVELQALGASLLINDILDAMQFSEFFAHLPQLLLSHQHQCSSTAVTLLQYYSKLSPLVSSFIPTLT